ncbi:MAG: hypothetical protein HRU69_01920 [Flammeovirgaceae bacterium]|nr:MAG: hypothetical protein HRU69_01920 [Flammeovirgaceae bacterium]
MQRILGLILMGVAMAGLSFGQIKKQFTVEDNNACETVRLKLKANSGNCFIKPSEGTDILNMFSNQEPESYSHQFVKEIKGKTCNVFVAVEESSSTGFSQTISSKVFGSEKPAGEKFWKIYLTDEKPYSLELNYGIGNSNIDLSGMAVKNLRITSASANVNVGYPTGLENKVEMDTFYIKVDLGSVNVRDLNLARTSHVVADVGFGNVMLDLSAKPSTTNTIRGSVAAGNLTILLPDAETPVFVKIKDSWLCSVRMVRGLKKIGEGTFASDSYTKDAPNALLFDLDVSMGNIIFKEKKN